MFKFLRSFYEGADNIINFIFNISTYEFIFAIEIFNFELRINIPFPLEFFKFHFYNLWYKENVSWFSRHEIVDCPARRYIERQLYFENNLKTGILFKIPFYPQEHDVRQLDMSILGFTFGIDSYHAWDVCHGEEEDRFPTREECIEYNEFVEKLHLLTFGVKKGTLNIFDPKYSKKYDKYWKECKKFYNSLPDKTALQKK